MQNADSSVPHPPGRLGQTCVSESFSTLRLAGRKDRTARQALRRLYACDVPAPDWALPGGMTDEETLEAEEARDKIIVTEFMCLVRLASELWTAWRDAAAPRVQWRD